MTEINREKICPFLLRVFYKEGDFNSLEDLSALKLPRDRELHMYTWIDASLRELASLIKDAVDCKKGNMIMNFSIVYTDSRGKLQRKEVGAVSSRKNQDDAKTLQQLKFTIGDYIDINISYEK
jgi:histone deacetylase complex subunit SAP18